MKETTIYQMLYHNIHEKLQNSNYAAKQMKPHYHAISVGMSSM